MPKWTCLPTSFLILRSHGIPAWVDFATLLVKSVAVDMMFSEFGVKMKFHKEESNAVEHGGASIAILPL